MATQFKIAALRPPKAPNLPIGPVDYDQRYQDNLLNALRLYFNQIDNFCQPLADPTGTAVLKFPNGSWYDTTTQTAATINTPTAVTFNTTEVQNGVSVGVGVGNTSKIYTSVPGYFNFQFSLQVTSATGSSQYIWVWPRINGVDVPDSNTKWAIQGTGAEVVAALNYILPIQAGQYFELMWAVSNTNVKILHEAANAFSPAIPSAILTTTFVSALY